MDEPDRYPVNSEAEIRRETLRHLTSLHCEQPAAITSRSDEVMCSRSFPIASGASVQSPSLSLVPSF